MPNMTGHSATEAWKLGLTPTAAGTKTYTLATKDKYVDQDIVVTETVAAGALADATGGAVTATVGLADTTYLTTTATGNYGPITATADASRTAVTVGVSTAGWIPTTVSKTSAAADATQDSVTKYIKAGKLQSVAGNAPVATAGFSASDDLTDTNTGFAVVATADAAATSKTGVDAVDTAGWVPANGSVTVTTPKATQATTTKYIKAGSLANSGTTGVTYTDASNTKGVVLVSGGYLYINRGMFDNIKISLAKLVPDGTDIKGAENYLYGKTAYDNDGTKVTGAMEDAQLKAEVTSATANASITSISPSWNNTNYSVTGSGSVSGTANVSASVTTSGLAVSATDNATGGKYVGVGATTATGSGAISGTASLSGVTLDATKLTVSGSDASATAPTISKTTDGNALSSAATTTKPSSGYYVAVKSGATSKAVTASVTATEGYTDGSHFANGSVTSKDITVSTPASAVTYVPITAGSATASASKGADGAVTPVIAKDATTTAKTGTLTTTKPAAGTYYVAVNTAAITASTSVTPSVTKTEGYIEAGSANGTAVSVTRGANAATTAYIPITAGGHTIAGNGTATVTKAAVTASVSGTGAANSGATYYGSATPLSTTKPSSGAYIEIGGSAASSTAGSISIPVKCTSTEGYVAAGTETFSATGSVGVDVTDSGKQYIAVYNGSYTVS